MGSYTQIGVDVTAVWDSSAAGTGTVPETSPYEPGMRHVAADGTKYIYTQAAASITNGTRHNVLDTGVTSSNASGAWANTTGGTVAAGDRFWAQFYTASNIITG